ncbi:MAG TPA: Sir2 family NAD-dependent protein deacetylase [Armatimonadota bacterium]|nr:Sir2 family NAD-dependent protein deacetylase [Armatimonadota bacterium]
MKLPEEFTARAKAAQRVVVFTGAVLAGESGLPVLPEKKSGPGEESEGKQLLSPQGFRTDPQRVWEWHAQLREKVTATAPGPAHQALRRLEEQVPEMVIITQNVDDLHERAGNRQVIHLHGSVFSNRWSREGRPLTDAELDSTSVPPRCACGAYARPNVVWMDEPLPQAALAAALDAVRQCDLCLIVGTDGMAEPVAALIDRVPMAAMRVVINPNRGKRWYMSNLTLAKSAGQGLPELVDALFGAA